ncbi:MAG: alkaline phosphatase D family protein [Ramlibacter sp.]
MKIAFTSCMDAERAPRQPVWQAIQREAPDVLMLLGDQIYMDWGLSVARLPQWKRIIERKGPAGLQLFAQDMHRRYALQWQVPEFQRLMRWFSTARNPDHLLVTWDEHDLAWNNAYGEGVDGNGHDDRTVPGAVRAVAQHLFRQFVAVLRNPDAAAAYPALDLPADCSHLPAPSRGVEGEPFDLNGVRFVLLDERSYRTHRDHPDSNAPQAHLLGARQQAMLFGALGQASLTVVAGSSPLRHGYLLGHQGWAAPPDAQGRTRDYPDYQAFQDAASASGKAVLYLAGDIHKNAWGGRIGTSPIVQAVSSGAALGNVLLKRFAPCYGMVTVGADGDLAAGQVRVALKRLDSDPPNPDAPGVDSLRLLRYDADGWQGPIPAADGDAVRFEGVASLDREVSVLCLRGRTAAFANAPGPLEFNGDNFESLYRADAAQTQDEYPEVVRLGPVPGGLRMRAQRSVNDAAPMDALLHEAFGRARDQQRAAVVLYVHGFGKDFADAVGQGLALARKYEVETIPVSWAAGEGSGLLGLLGAVLQGQREAEDFATTGRLRRAVLAFGRVGLAYPGIRKVIVVRSLGSLPFVGGMSTFASPAALAAEWGRPPHEVIDRLVLSSAAVPVNRHNKWLSGWGLPACVTINRDDARLKIYNWLEIGQVPLGMSEPMLSKLGDQARYFDCTALDGVGLDHDYLLRDQLNPALEALNRAMVRGEPMAPPFDGFDAVTAHDAFYTARHA